MGAYWKHQWEDRERAATSRGVSLGQLWVTWTLGLEPTGTLENS